MRKSDLKKDTVSRTTARIVVGSKTGEYYEIPYRQDPGVVAIYNKLSTGKIIGESAKLQSLKYAEVMYQPSLYANLTLLQGSQTIAEMQVLCTLPEHVQAFANYWIGQTIDSQSFMNLVSDFRNKMKALRVANVNVTRKPTSAAKITSIATTLSYV
jgi:hypothetical protein